MIEAINKFLNRKSLKYIRQEWGEENNKKRDFKNIRVLFDYLKEGEEDREGKTFYIDDQTWEDLNMNEVYSKLDRTFSFCGKQALYNILRRPFLKEKALKERDSIIDFFKDNEEAREKLLLELSKLDVRDTGAVELFFNKLEGNRILKIVCNILALIPIVLGVLIYIYGIKSKFTMYLLMSTFLNGIIHYKAEGKLNYKITAMSTLGRMIKVGKNISKLNVDEICSYKSKLEEKCNKTMKIFKNTYSLIQIKGLDEVMEYFNLVFLVRERDYLSTVDEINKYQKELKEIYMILGELDAIISIASFREQYGERYTKPILKEEGKFLKTKNIAHPIIENPIPNSIEMINKGIILTGSNMSGKSTFLRTLGVNALLAQTIYMCNAESYEGSYFKIITSISPEDNLASGKSYYFGEVEALLRIINSDEEKVPTLSLIDEIFRGTNPVERVSAAKEILKYFSSHNTLVAVATHDLELPKLLKDRYNSYYFREEVEGNELKFDYLIKEGISPTKNAIRILRMVGYPQEIVDNAEADISTCE